MSGFQVAEPPKVCMIGCHEFGGYLIPRLIEKGLRFSHFFTISPQQATNAKVSGYHDFTELSKKHNIPLTFAKNYSLETREDRNFFESENFDLVIQGGWQRLLPDYLLKTLRIGSIGVHGSPDFLPKGRGRSPKNWSIIHGRKRFILHLFLMNQGADDGAVFDYETFDINEFDDINTLYYKNVLAQEIMLERSFIPLISGNIKFTEQLGKPDYFPKRSEEDGWFDFESCDVFEIHNLIRAQTKPYPGAFCDIEELGRVRIWKAQIFDTRLKFPTKKYGSVVAEFGDRLVLNCRGGLLLINEFEKLRR